MKVEPTFCLQRAEQVIETHASGLPASILKSGLRVATQFRSESADEEGIPLGASHLGGPPHMPSSAAWPTWDGFPEPDRILDEQLPPHGS